MHYHLEVILPPVSNINDAVTEILRPFDENAEERSSAFWDWWVIGGRYSGSKAESRFPPDKLEAFKRWLIEEKVTVSGLQVGKQELAPASQIIKVDAKWREMFGVEGPCTLFRHSNANSEELDGDICPLREAMQARAYRVIIAGPGYEGGLTASYMIEEEFWNGVSHTKSTWDGRLASAVEQYKERLSRSTDEYRAAHIPKPDWITVTVDYHS